MSEYIYDWTPNKQHRKEEVVRCRDCKHLNKLSREHESYECRLTYMDVTLDDFCSWAERRQP